MDGFGSFPGAVIFVRRGLFSYALDIICFETVSVNDPALHAVRHLFAPHELHQISGGKSGPDVL